MTCYFRHLKNVFQKAEIVVSKDNRQEIDKIIHGIVGVAYKNCPATWRAVSTRLAENEVAFIEELRASILT